MDKSHRKPVPLGPEDYEAIGALAAHYSLMEFNAAVAVWTILKLPGYDGTLVTGPLSLSQRFDLINNLLEHRHADVVLIKTIKEIALEFSKEEGITARRNRYIHAVWGAGEVAIVRTLNFTRQGRFKIGDHTAADLIEATTRDITIQLKRFQDSLRDKGFFSGDAVVFRPPQRPSPPSDASAPA